MSKALQFRVFGDQKIACSHVASEIATLIRERAVLGRKAVIGFSLGNTPLPLYDELIYLHREEGLSFRNVITFNLEEYLGLPTDHPRTVQSHMKAHLFDHVDIPKDQTNFLQSDLNEDEIRNHCRSFKASIHKAGMIDIQILGVGRTGNLGFSGIGSNTTSPARKVRLDSSRSEVDSSLAAGTLVPEFGLTVGCETILLAKRIYILAWGVRKMKAVQKLLENPDHPKSPISALTGHRSAQLILDTAASSALAELQKN